MFVNIPNVKRIEKCAFQCCKQLLEVGGQKIEYIGDLSFSECY